LRSADTSGARFCLTKNQVTRQLGSETTQCTSPLSNRIPHCSDRSQFSPFYCNLSAHSAATLGTALQQLCALLATTTCGYYAFALHGAARVQHAAGEYATFIVVVGTFFVVASPLANVTFLFGGSKFHRHDWRVDAFASSLSAHEPRPW
jgi:hypothetical protein